MNIYFLLNLKLIIGFHFFHLIYKKIFEEKNDYDIVDVYNDAGHSGKDLMRPEMQRLLKDIKSKKIDKLVAIKVDRLTRNNYDGFWLLNYCEEHDVKIELILEKGYIILKPKAEPRKGWDKAFMKMHENGDDQLLMNDVFEDENFEEWSK